MSSSRSRRYVAGAVTMMTVVVLLSNILVQFPINDWLTWGAFTYPVAFLVTDVVNRMVGARQARVVAAVGFVIAVLCSIWLATPRIALASGAAFLASQLTDIEIFNGLRRYRWWVAPLFSNAFSACLDTAIFWSIAFAGDGTPWITWALGDLCVKLIMASLVVGPFRLMTRGRALRNG